jgi:hypothetical protein
VHIDQIEARSGLRFDVGLLVPIFGCCQIPWVALIEAPKGGRRKVPDTAWAFTTTCCDAIIRFALLLIHLECPAMNPKTDVLGLTFNYLP